MLFPEADSQEAGRPERSRQCANLGFFRFPWVSSGFLGLPQVSLGFLRFPGVSLGFPGFPQVPLGFLGSLGFLRFP